MKDNIEDDKPAHIKQVSSKGIKGAVDERISIGVLLPRRQRWDCARSQEYFCCGICGHQWNFMYLSLVIRSITLLKYSRSEASGIALIVTLDGYVLNFGVTVGL